MRNVLHTIYLTLLRFQGIVVVSFVILLLIGALRSDLPGLRHPVAMSAALMSMIAGVVFASHRLTPRILSHPAGVPSAILVAVLHAVAPFIFMVPVMMSVVAFEIAEPMSRYIAITAAAGVYLCSAGLWWTGVILSIMGGITPPSAPDAYPHDGFDFRGAR